MNLRTVITESSVWQFDLDLKRYIRFPKNENPDGHPSLAYTGEWDDYTEIEEIEDMWGKKLMVHRPVPFGTGASRQTGVIISDSVNEKTDSTDGPT